jgi:hypothetical protein
VDPQGPDGLPISVFESGAILLYLAQKTGRFLPKDARRQVAALEWLMWQMGGFGPMPGQVHHFLGVKDPLDQRYGLERYSKETKRLYGVADRRLADYFETVAKSTKAAPKIAANWVMGELAGALLDEAGDAVEVFAAFAAGHFSPNAVGRALGGGVGRIDIGGTGERNFGEFPLVGRINGIEIFAALRRDEFSVDEKIVARLQLRIGRFRRWIESPEIAENEFGRTATDPVGDALGSAGGFLGDGCRWHGRTKNK